jgi:hypothetical protein
MDTPKQFRKKPIVIWAIQFDGTNRAAVDAFVSDATPIIWRPTESMGGWIETLEGSMEFGPADFIIRGVKNELYPCKGDIFEMSYDEDVPDAN